MLPKERMQRPIEDDGHPFTTRSAAFVLELQWLTLGLPTGVPAGGHRSRDPLKRFSAAFSLIHSPSAT